MEDLTKTQIVLLTLLVSFVTSIAAGIITTSLLAQAPVGVTQTINRVVERTIEKVIPESKGQVVKEVTVVKEEDAILSSIEKVTSGIVRIKVKGGDGVELFYGLGAVVNKDGTVVADGQWITQDATYTATLPDGAVLPLVISSEKSSSGLILFKLTADATHKEFPAIALAPALPRLGQSVVAIEGKEKTSIAVGRVTSVNTKAGLPKSVTTINTDMPSKGELPGSPLVNLSGELVGIKASLSDLSLPPGEYVAEDPIRALLGGPRR